MLESDFKMAKQNSTIWHEGRHKLVDLANRDGNFKCQSCEPELVETKISTSSSTEFPRQFGAKPVSCIACTNQA